MEPVVDVAEALPMIGTLLGHYKVTSQLGKGGMGEVYQARDQKLGRDVAIKVLPNEFARDADRVARFQREAKLLASLNHPNIAAIYGLEESAGTHFLVMELIEGQTLAEVISGSPGVLAGKTAAETGTLQEILKIVLQIAEALEAAHEKGVVHRDLKPANIKVTPDGKVKVLDFGLAKAFVGEQGNPDLSSSPTLSNAATQMGVILGTPSYMSPEQARGKTVDKRTDIWAFGCILYEMLTGQQLFKGDTVSDTLASVLTKEPEWERIPASVIQLLQRCLSKDPNQRSRDIGDVRLEIMQILADSRGVFSRPAGAALPRARPFAMLPWFVAVTILAAMIGGVLVWRLKPTEPKQVTRFQYSLPEESQRTDASWPVLAVSPDGRQFAFASNTGLYVRSAEKMDSRRVSSANDNPLAPFFSPDGQWIGFWSQTDSRLKKVAVTGGIPVPLCDTGTFLEASWNTDNTILFAEQQRGILRVSADGGTPEILIAVKKNEVFYHPRLLPDGKTVLFTTGPSPYKVVVESIETHKRKVAITDGDCAWYLPTEHIVYASGNNLFAVSFNLSRLETTGGRISLGEAIHRRSATFAPQYAVSDSGTLAYIPPPAVAGGRNLVWVDRNGKEELLAAPSNTYSNPRISPNGRRIALTISADGNSDIQIWDVVRESLARLTFEAFPDSSALWASDGQRILFASNRVGYYGVYWRKADGIGDIEQAGLMPERWNCFPVSWTGKRNSVLVNYLTNSYDIGELSMGRDRSLRPLMTGKANEIQPHVSPDGRWLAYASDESGEFEVYVRSFPDVESGGQDKVSTSGGHSPLWSPDGKELFYRNGDAVMAVPVAAQPTFSPEKPKTLFRNTYVSSNYAAMENEFDSWDISPVDKRFLMIKEPGPPHPPREVRVRSTSSSTGWKN